MRGRKIRLLVDLVRYGSQTGTAQDVAERIDREGGDDILALKFILWTSMTR